MSARDAMPDPRTPWDRDRSLADVILLHPHRQCAMCGGTYRPRHHSHSLCITCWRWKRICSLSSELARQVRGVAR
jgi:hypothetical protein